MAILEGAAQSRITLETNRFSFAYLKEAYVSALLGLARRTVAPSTEVDYSTRTKDFATLLQDSVESLSIEMSSQAIVGTAAE